MMGTYTASLRASGDNTSLPATIQLDDGQLSIAAGSQEIGTWSLSDIELEEVPNGYRMVAEGDHIIIELKELDAFREALSTGRFKRRFKLRGKERKAADTPKPVDTPSPRAVTPAAPSVGTESKPGGTALDGFTQRVLALVDSIVAKAEKQFGPYLPEWVFSRAMFFMLAGAIVIMVVLPGIFSTLLLVVGGVLVALGAVTYSDPMLASRWLPGRTQPPHVLIGGVATLLVGVLIGVLLG